jgi:hypothetical protein
VGLERSHAEGVGQNQGLLVMGFGLCGIGGISVGLDDAKLMQRERLVPVCPLLPGQVERLTGVLPGLVDASGEEIDRAELPEVADIMAAQRACAEIVPPRLLQER